jgi:alkanesulfonate monooxygenase SsuD/methylene tetrahydromethanopterin reductase-like flavin-dependent oxidoreductase (luciferase family)
VEQGAFQIDPRDLHDQWREALTMIPRMWQSEVFEFKGRFFDVPATRVVPKPLQKPHPPIFAACSKPESAVAVGELGIGALNFALGSDAYLADKVRDYRSAVARAQPSGWQVNDHFACAPPCIVLDDDAEACRHGFRGARFFAEALGRYYFGGDRPVEPLVLPRDDLATSELDEAMAFRGESDAPLSAIVGDPGAAREQVKRFADAGVDELILLMQMGTVPHEVVMRSLRCFAEKVMPHF